MLIEQLQAQRLVLRKKMMNTPVDVREIEIQSSLLTTLISEASMIGKNDGNRTTTDNEVIAVVKKFLKNIEETLNVLSEDNPKFESCIIERSLLLSLLPQQMDESQIRFNLNKIANENGLSGPKSMGQVLKMMKAEFDGKYDGALAAKIAKEILV